MSDNDAIDQAIRILRADLKKIGGVKLRMETLSWGRHANFIFEGPVGQTHRAGNVAPTWWTDAHIEKHHQVVEACKKAKAALDKADAKLPGLLR